MKGLKQILGLLMVMLISVTMFGQSTVFKKLENQDSLTLTEGQKDSAIFYTKYDLNKDGVMEVYQLPYRVLESAVNLFRTEYGNVSGVDSVAKLHGVTLYPDSTVVNSNLIVATDTIKLLSEHFLLKDFVLSSQNYGTYTEKGFGFSLARFKATNPNNSMILELSGAGGSWDMKSTRSTRNIDTYYSEEIIVKNKNRYDTAIVKLDGVSYQFDTTKNSVRNNNTGSLSDVFVYEQGKVLTKYIIPDLSYSLTLAETYEKQLYAINRQIATYSVPLISKKGIAIPVLTVAEFDTIKSDLGGSVPKGYTFNLDSNTDGVGDAILHYNGFEFVVISQSVYGGGLVTPD